MNPSVTSFCALCSRELLGEWKGWPLRDPIPELPRMNSPKCGSCGNSEVPLLSTQIFWLNCHGPYSTGLPDYWLLVTDRETWWGRPYFGEVSCHKCGRSSVLSQHGDARNNSFEYKINCASCGLVRPRPGISPKSTHEP